MVEGSSTLREELPQIIGQLRQPTGDDSRFATIEGMRSHRTEFLSRVHDTWKHLHAHAIDELLKTEAILRSPDSPKLPPGFAAFLRYSMAIWHRINDALVWSVFGFEGHRVRRLCHRRDRPLLSYANPASIRRFLDQLNSDRLTFALWTDSTSCVDVGDVISRSFSGGPTGIFEVKEGSVNNTILDLIFSTGDLEAKVRQIETFARRHGDKGITHLERVAKQLNLLANVEKILQSDEGFDPYWQAQVFVRETRVQDQSYDTSLATLVEFSGHEPVLDCIDQCVWVYIDRDPAKSFAHRVQAFSAALFARSPAIGEWNGQWHQSSLLKAVVPLDANLFEPMAIPLFFRPFAHATIRDILIGRLKGRVLLWFDWVAYAAIVESLGAKLTWSSKKAGRAEHSLPHHQRVLTVGERIPQIGLPDGRVIRGQSQIYRVLFEGILPSVVAARYVETLHAAPETAQEEDSS